MTRHLVLRLPRPPQTFVEKAVCYARPFSQRMQVLDILLIAPSLEITPIISFLLRRSTYTNLLPQ